MRYFSLSGGFRFPAAVFVLAGLLAGGCGERGETPPQGPREIGVERPAPAPQPAPEPVEAAGFTVGTPVSYANLTLFPLAGPAAAQGIDYLTLDQGIESGLVRIMEKSRSESADPANRLNFENVPEPMDPALMLAPDETPDAAPVENQRFYEQEVQQYIQVEQGLGLDAVNELMISNDSDKPLFIMAGEVIKGGKQNRMVQRDVVIPPRSGETPLGVFCVEQGRWSHRTDEFESAKFVSHGNLRLTAQKGMNQTEVWDEVAEMNRLRGVTSQAEDYVEQLEAETGDKVLEYVESLVRALALEADTIGLAAAVGDRIVAVDIFGAPELFAKLKPKLIAGYAIEAVALGGDEPAAVTARDVAAFLADARSRDREVSVHSEDALTRGLHVRGRAVEGFETVHTADGEEILLHKNYYSY